MHGKVLTLPEFRCIIKGGLKLNFLFWPKLSLGHTEDTMKNWAILVVVVVFSLPAFAQRGSGSRFEEYFGWQSTGRGRPNSPTGDTAGAAVKEEAGEESRDLSSVEILRAFVEKGFVITPEEESATFVAEMDIFSRERQNRFSRYGGSYYRYNYHRDPESLVYLTVRNRETGAVVAVGRGKSANIRRAAEKAANDAAKKLRRYYKNERTIFLP